MTSGSLPSLLTPPSRDAIAEVAAARVRHALFGGAPPAVLGRYRCARVLGSGGQGTVFVGEDPLLRRNVALKLVDTAAEPSAVRQVLREAQLLARVGHPNIAAVFDVGIVGRRVYLALELVEGGTLRGWLDRGPRSIAEIMAPMTQVADALAFAHRCGVVHCDVKPQNVLVGLDGRARVVDFGLARLCTPTVSDDSITQPGPVSSGAQDNDSRPAGGGTPAYAAPEIWRGEPTSAFADQFSFCVMVYEAIAGQRPWSTTPGQAREIDPDAALPRAAAMPWWLHRVLARGLSIDPRARWPTMDELCVALRRPRGTRRMVMGVAAVALAAGSVGMATLGRDDVAPSETPIACAPAPTTLEARVRRAAAVSAIAAIDPASTSYVVDRLDGFAARTGTMQVAGCRDDPGARRCSERREAEHAAALAILAAGRVRTRAEVGAILDDLETTELDARCSENAVEGRAGELLAEARVLLRSGRATEALSIATLACADAVPGSLVRAECDIAIGEPLLVTGRLDEAHALLQSAYDVAAASDNLGLAGRAAVGLVKLATDRHRRDEADRWIAALESIAARTVQPRLAFAARLARAQLAARSGEFEAAIVELDALAAADYSATQLQQVEALLGLVRGRLGQTARAHQHFARALELASQHYSSAGVATVRVFIAQQLIDEGRYDESLVEYRAAYDLALVDQGHDSVVAIHARTGLGDVLSRLGRYEEALVVCDAAVEHAMRRDDAQDQTIALNTRANLLNAMGRFTEARRDALSAVSIGEADIGSAAEIRNSRLALAAAIEGLGDLVHAREVAREAVAESEELFGADHVETMTSVVTLATIAFRLGDVHEAIALHVRARDTYVATFGRFHPGVATECYNLAEAWLELDRPDLATPEAECAVEVWREVLGDEHPDTRDAAVLLAKATASRGA